MNESIIVVDKSLECGVNIKNNIFTEKNISYKAIGIYCEMVCAAIGKDKQVTHMDLSECKKDGRTSVSSGIKELMNFGYVDRQYLRGIDGKVEGIKYWIYETPMNNR
ncbi:MAG: hypothetical protein ACRCX8_07720 [Sarcina sp.]